MSTAAIWQQVEFGSYRADLPVWSEIAAGAGGPILELGAGAGRVALHLAGEGHQVIALEHDPELAAELESAAQRIELDLTVARGDLDAPSALSVPASPALVIAPLHVLQVIDPPARLPLLRRLREVILPEGLLAATVVDESTLLGPRGGAPRILPDMRELDGWVYSSEPLWVQVTGETLIVRRVRECVSPEGAMDRSIHDEVLQRLAPDRLESEGEEAGFTVAARRAISSDADEADSVVVVLRSPG